MKRFNIAIITTALTLITAQPTLQAMARAKGKERTSYRLVEKNNSEVMVSELLVQSSPTLQKRAKGTDESTLTLDCDASVLSFFPFIDNLLILTKQKKIEAILALDNKKFASFMKALFYLESRDLLDFSLQIYCDKITQIKRVEPATVGMASLVDLSASCIARNFDRFDGDLLKALPIDAQLKILQKTPINHRNFDELYQWMERLQAEFSSKTPISLSFSAEQYDALAAVAYFKQATAKNSKELLRYLNSLNGQGGKVKLSLLRHILHDGASSLSKIKRYKLAWRLAFQEQSEKLRDAILDELALFHVNNKDDRELIDRIPDYYYGKIYEYCSLIDNTPVLQIFFIKAKYKLHFTKLKKKIAIQDLWESGYTKDTDFSNCVRPFSPEFIICRITKLRKQLTATPFKILSKQFDLLVALISCMELNQDWSNKELFPSFLTQLYGDLQYAEARYASLAKFSGLPLHSTIDVEQQKTLDMQFCNQVEYFLTTLPFQIQQTISMLKPIPRDPTIRRAAPINRADQISRDSYGAALEHLKKIIIQGANLNTQDQTGNTIAHRAFVTENHFLIDFIRSITAAGLGKIDMHCPNAKGETPLMLFHRIELTRMNYERLSSFAKTVKQTFSARQSAKIKELLNARTETFFFELEKMLTNKVTGFEEALWYINSPETDKTKATMPCVAEKIRLGWLLAIKQTDQERVNTLFAALRAMPNNAAQSPGVPKIFCLYPFEHLLTLIKRVQNGFIFSAQDIANAGAYNVLQFLKFSNCLWQYLYRLKTDTEQSEALVNAFDLNRLCAALLQGADIDYQDSSGNTIWHRVLSTGNEELLAFLLEAFKGRIDLSKKNIHGCTPLLIAAQHPTKSLKLVNMLLNSCDIKALNVLERDNSGKVALDYLRDNGPKAYKTYDILTGDNNEEESDEDLDSESESESE